MMSDRCIFDDYEIRGQPFEVWTDGHCNPGEYQNWWLITNLRTLGFPNLPRATVLTGEEPGFDPPLTEIEIRNISEAVYDWISNAD